MSDSKYKIIFTGNFIFAQLVCDRLEAVGIQPIVKDEHESGRLAGFAPAIQGQQHLLVHEDQFDNAKSIVESINDEMESNVFDV